ncbi:hypothetical protein [Kineosporia succinea]|uniref:HEAT repeat protein n=1 Tax=Kineosporia succinea TaxID=84632 RepID=A0ABT9P5N5_9ACTN|nr:hypothetical protein [Kineosporia succinea]MDP9827998.1 hypothetical protein [Kineosporia succinea]
MIPSADPVDWPSLTHAYGPATDTPELIGQLWGRDWPDAVEALYGSILHQGGIYPATVAAMPSLAAVAQEKEAPGRLGALQLLSVYGEAVLGLGPEHDLLTAALDTLERVALDLLPLTADLDPEVRMAVYECSAHWTVVRDTDAVAAALRERLAVETDSAARVALMEPLARHGLLTGEALDALTDDDVRFAAVWSAVALGLDLPGALEELARLWPVHAQEYPTSDPAGSLELMVQAAGARAVPVLLRLASVDDSGLTAEDLAYCWCQVADLSRPAGRSAVDGLLAVVEGLAGAGRETEELAAVVAALGYVLPGSPERTAEVCDVVAALDAEGGPELEAARMVMLFGARDERWARGGANLTEAAELPGVNVGDTQLALPAALTGFRTMRSVAWAEAGLLDLIARATAAWPARAGQWVPVLAQLPPSRAVVHQLIAVLGADPRPGAEVLAGLAARHPEAFDDDLRARAIEALAAQSVQRNEDEAWLLAARAAITRDPDGFEPAWRLGAAGFAAEKLLAVWSAFPSPALIRVCRGLTAEKVRRSYPGRAVQLAAVEVLMAQPLEEHEDLVWPALLAQADAAGPPLETTLPLGHRVVAKRPARLPEWLDLLRDIATNGRESWAGRDQAARALALDHLAALGALTPDEAVEQALSLQIGTPGTAAVVESMARVLHRAVVDRPDLRERAATHLAPLLKGDHRIPSAGAPEADARLVLTLEKALV